MAKKKCSKEKTYPTVSLAQKAIIDFKESATGSIPVKIYWCAQHKGYHLSRISWL